MTTKIRAFIAIELDQHVRDALIQVQNKLRVSDADVKWTAPNDIHLTLKFLGDIFPSDTDTVSLIISKSVTGISPFIIDITELGAFPDILFPKIVWAGVTKNTNTLIKIAKELDTDLVKVKIKKNERPFTAHITLGRERSLCGKDRLSAALEETNIPPNLS
ncbi:MAG: RNA 2',3'-cyclic phosphodiesterase, partial [Candidatus Omnitrophica bacterium]|nr:RNA 2',3'-cyclic phosphodiesterase [Candidatus Omnitrophota bacterium]